MTNFEFQRLITIGQYLPTASLIHRLDPRARLLMGGMLLMALTVSTHVGGIMLGIICILGMLALSKVPLRYAVRGLLPPLPFIAFLALLQILFGPQRETMLFSWGPVHISTLSILNAVTLTLRFAALVLTVSWMSLCMSTSDMIRGLEALLHPLNKIRFPTQDFILMIQVALHFVPILAREAERIAKAQASRGADWGTGKGGLLRRARQAMPILVPLFLAALQRAETMALAMEARGYRGTGRTSMKTLQFQRVDGLAVLLTTIVAIGIILI